jgi:hypothetical protein
MLVTDQFGLELTVLVRGNHEEPEIEEIQYVDSDEEVPEEVVEYVQDRYAIELSEEAHQYQVMRAEYAFERETANG